MYEYNISDFPNNKFSIDRLTREIQSSTIVISLDFINTSATEVFIYFKSDLSAGDKDILDSIIGNHSGEPLPENTVQNVKVVVEQPKYIETGNTTQELFCAESIVLDIPASEGSHFQDISWPFNIGLKSSTFYVSDSMIGDAMRVKIAPNTLVGALIAPLNIGDTSIYVSPTVIQYVKYGQYVGLYAAQQELGRVVMKGENYLILDKPSESNAAAGSLIAMCAKIVPYVFFTIPGKIEIGKTVTTADRVPANTKIRIEYINNTGTAKKVSFLVEYLY